MEEKKEVQKQIVDVNPRSMETSEGELLSVLRNIAPGTNLRVGLDGSLKIGNGALIVVENENTFPLFEGGFRINCKFTPQKLMELSKMDGAILLSKDMKRIMHSNVLLIPDSKIRTHETGTRHKAAERTAKQAGTLTIAISQRKNEITLYYKNMRYPIIDAGELLRKANENLQILEKQRDLFDRGVEKLNRLEMKTYFNLKQAINLIQKGKLIQKLFAELKKNSVEVGKEGTLLKIRLKEITLGVDKETDLVVRDYAKFEIKRSRLILDNLSYDEILDEDVICKILGYENPNSFGEIKGWRILSKTSLSEAEAAKVINELGNLEGIMLKKFDSLTHLIGDKVRILAEEIAKMQTSD